MGTAKNGRCVSQVSKTDAIPKVTCVQLLDAQENLRRCRRLIRSVA